MIKHFFKDYRLPLETTFLFILIVVIMLSMRTFDRIALANVLGGKTGSNADYGALLSKDQTEGPTKKEINTPESVKVAEKSTSNTSAQFTVSPSPPSNVAPVPGSPSEPAPPFSAEVTGLVLENSTIECDVGTLGIQDCSKRYFFRANIRAIGGPGSIHFAWLSNVSASATNGEFIVGSGETFTPLRNEVSLSCSKPELFDIQLTLSEPTIDKSNIIEQNHDCSSDIPLPTLP